MIFGFGDTDKSKVPINITYENGVIKEYESNEIAGRSIFRIIDSTDYYTSSTIALSQGFNVSEIEFDSDDYYYPHNIIIINPYIDITDSVSSSAYAFVVGLEPVFYQNTQRIEKMKVLIYSSGSFNGIAKLNLVHLGTQDSE